MPELAIAAAITLGPSLPTDPEENVEMEHSSNDSKHRSDQDQHSMEQGTDQQYQKQKSGKADKK